MSDKVIITSDGKHRLYWCAECGTRRLGSVHRLPKGWIRKRKTFERLVWCKECRGTTRMTDEDADRNAKIQAETHRKGKGFSLFRAGYSRRVGAKR